MTEHERSTSPTTIDPGAVSTTAVPSTTVHVPGNHLMTQLLGSRDEWLDRVEAAFVGTRIVARGNEINVEGPDAIAVGRIFEELVIFVEGGTKLDEDLLRRTIDMVAVDELPSQLLGSDVVRLARGGSVRPKTAGQRRYIDTYHPAERANLVVDNS